MAERLARMEAAALQVVASAEECHPNYRQTITTVRDAMLNPKLQQTYEDTGLEEAQRFPELENLTVSYCSTCGQVIFPTDACRTIELARTNSQYRLKRPKTEESLE